MPHGQYCLNVLQGSSECGLKEFSSLAREALVLHLCAHPNVVPVTILGLQPYPSPLHPLDPRQVAYFGMPMADMSLQKRFGYVAILRHALVVQQHVMLQ